MSGDEAIPELCEHIRPVAEHLVASGAKVVGAGTPWSRNCKLWVYFDRSLDCNALIEQLNLPSCVKIHDHVGTHDGSELGLDCEIHHDAVMGPHPGR